MPKIKVKRQTDHINRHQAENICHAFDFAKWIGCPLNFYIVINLKNCDDGVVPTEAFQALLEKYRDWLCYVTKKLGREKVAPAYVFSHENPDDFAHVNWVVHVPAHLREEFLRKLPTWVGKVQTEVREFDISIEEVDPFTDKTLAKYVIKGTDPRYVPYLHLQEVAAPQGRIEGRRASSSIAIGRAAREAANFIPKRDRNKWMACAA